VVARVKGAASRKSRVIDTLNGKAAAEKIIWPFGEPNSALPDESSSAKQAGNRYAPSGRASIESAIISRACMYDS